jgi:hypothetical protein
MPIFVGITNPWILNAPRKPYITKEVISNSNMMSFFHLYLFMIYLDDKISLAHKWCTHLSQRIKAQNTIIYSCPTFSTSILTENNQHIQKLINMWSAIKTCQHNIIVTAVPLIRLSRCKSTCCWIIVCSNLAGWNRTANMRHINCVWPCPQT